MEEAEYPENQRTHPKATLLSSSLASVPKFMVEIVETSIHKSVCLGMGGGLRPDAQQCARRPCKPTGK